MPRDLLQLFVQFVNLLFQQPSLDLDLHLAGALHAPAAATLLPTAHNCDTIRRGLGEDDMRMT